MIVESTEPAFFRDFEAALRAEVDVVDLILPGECDFELPFALTFLKSSISWVISSTSTVSCSTSDSPGKSEDGFQSGSEVGDFSRAFPLSFTVLTSCVEDKTVGGGLGWERRPASRLGMWDVDSETSATPDVEFKAESKKAGVVNFRSSNWYELIRTLWNTQRSVWR